MRAPPRSLERKKKKLQGAEGENFLAFYPCLHAHHSSLRARPRLRFKMVKGGDSRYT